jgi:hypothetical protein
MSNRENRKRPFPFESRIPFSTEQIAKIVELRDDDGLPFIAIAERFSCLPNKVSKAYKAAKTVQQ